MTTIVLIVVEVEGDQPEEAFAAVDKFLDFGSLQAALNDHEDSPKSAESLNVISVYSTTPHRFIESQRGK